MYQGWEQNQIAWDPGHGQWMTLAGALRHVQDFYFVVDFLDKMVSEEH